METHIEIKDKERTTSDILADAITEAVVWKELHGFNFQHARVIADYLADHLFTDNPGLAPS